MNTQAAATDPRARLIVALDVPTRAAALDLVRKLSPHPGLFKIGLQLFIAAGPEIVREICDLGSRVFLDLKLHDIPNTVGRSVESASSLGAELREGVTLLAVRRERWTAARVRERFDGTIRSALTITCFAARAITRSQKTVP